MLLVGGAHISPDQARSWLRIKGGHQRLIDVVDFYWWYARLRNIRPEILLAQACKETAFGHYTGVVPPGYNNFAGIKTRTGGPSNLAASHEIFDTPEMGVIGHVNHVDAYIRGRASDPIGKPHPRYLSARTYSWAGTIRTTQEMGQKWAEANSTSYGDHLDQMVAQMETTMPEIAQGFQHKDLGPDGGAWLETDDPKFELHTTEGSTLAGAESAFGAYPPHFGVSFEEGLRRQYVGLERASYSNKANDGARLYQVEIVGFAAQSRNWTDAKLKWLGEQVFRPIMVATGVPKQIVYKGFHDGTEGIRPYISTAESPLRLTYSELHSFSGILGHQHMPSPDTHWDPGALNVQKILEYAFPGVPLTGRNIMADIYAFYRLYLKITADEIEAEVTGQWRRDLSWHTWEVTSGRKTLEQKRAEFEAMGTQWGLYDPTP